MFTYKKRLQRRLMFFAERHPENCRFKSQNNEGRMTFEIDKGRLSIHMTAQYTEESRKVFCECAKKHGLNEQGTAKTLVGLRESVQKYSGLIAHML